MEVLQAAKSMHLLEINDLRRKNEMTQSFGLAPGSERFEGIYACTLPHRVPPEIQLLELCALREEVQRRNLVGCQGQNLEAVHPLCEEAKGEARPATK